ASPVEQSLIAALATRYEDPPPADRALLDLAYAEAMRAARELHPRDADVAALTAEALMDLHPWDFYAPDGRPKPWTPELLEVIQAALALAPNHPMGNHLWIHAIEASNDPAQAKAAADLLRTLQPGLGHMVHMPSHIDVRTGEWEQALEANKRAIVADANYRSVAPELGFYALSIAHHRHMYAWAAMMSGRGAQAQRAVTQLVDALPASFRTQSPALVDAWYALPLEVLMRFGKWDEILAFPEPDEDLPASRALRHAARGVAFAARADVASARHEQQQFEQARARVPADFVRGQNPVSSLNEIASHLLAGEILYRDHQEEAGLAELRKAVEAEDLLRYDEPPDWIQPTRHALGAALTQSRKYQEAEAVFREDLRRTPRNGWALFGLARALRLQGKNAEAQKVEQQFGEVWSKADVQLQSACLSQAGR
ncbi:MAG: Tetratricopeptide repeat protein, partial [Myxococcaceae bacterium]|nr:Tetratricopeptide repeat protein [Myxococcaceae bacterium]